VYRTYVDESKAVTVGAGVLYLGEIQIDVKKKCLLASVKTIPLDKITACNNYYQV